MTPWADAIFSLWWLATNLLLVGMAAKVAARLFPRSGPGQRLLHITVLSVATVTAITTLLGALGLISGPALLAGGCLFAGLVLLGLSRRTRDTTPDEVRALLPTGRFRAGLLWPLFWGVAGATLLVHVVVMGLFQFPDDFDCLMYHMPLMDLWIQQGSLYVPDFGANWFLAANNEVLALWLTAPFSGDFLAALNNVPAIVIWATALVQLGRQLGLRGSWAHLAAFVTMMVLTLDQQYHNISNDIAVAAYFVAGLSYSLRYVKSLETCALWLAGACIGLLAGVKYFALGYAMVLIAIILAMALLVRGPRAAARAAGVFALTVPLLGGYWYLRNWVLTGTPLYPMGFRKPTEVLGYPEIWKSTLAGNGDPRVFEYALGDLADVWPVAPTGGLAHAGLARLAAEANRPSRRCLDVPPTGLDRTADAPVGDGRGVRRLVGHALCRRRPTRDAQSPGMGLYAGPLRPLLPERGLDRLGAVPQGSLRLRRPEAGIPRRGRSARP